MGTVIADQAMALDGFSAGPHVGVGNGLGDGGEQLHAWMFAEGDGAAVNAGGRADTPFTLLQQSGAVVVGRRMVDLRAEEPRGTAATACTRGRAGRTAAPTGWPRP